MGGPLVVVGHGLRERQVLGPAAPGAAPQLILLRLRRYRCIACRAIITVAPRGVLRRRLYAASAIAWALARVGLQGAATAHVRAEISPAKVIGIAAAQRWISVPRWIEASREGRLFPQFGRHGASCQRRQVAERTAMQLMALAPPSAQAEPRAHAAWRGGVLAA